MATEQELRNQAIGTNLLALGQDTSKGVAQLLDGAVAIWLITPNLVIAPTQEINLAFINSLQVSGDLIVIKNLETFEQNGNDDTIDTSENDRKKVQILGNYNWTATFSEGMYQQRALTSLVGFGNWSTIIITKDGSIAMAENLKSAGGSRGFKTGMIRVPKLVVGNAVGQKSMIDIQFLKRSEVDDKHSFFDIDLLDFDPREVDSIIQVFLSVPNAPANLETVLTVKAVLQRGKSEAVTGFAFGDWLNEVDGVASNPTAGDDTVLTGTFVLTVPAFATGEKGEISLNGNIEVTGDAIYKSNTVKYTVV